MSIGSPAFSLIGPFSVLFLSSLGSQPLLFSLHTCSFRSWVSHNVIWDQRVHCMQALSNEEWQKPNTKDHSWMTSLGRRELELASGRDESRDRVSAGLCLVLGVLVLFGCTFTYWTQQPAASQQLPPFLWLQMRQKAFLLSFYWRQVIYSMG